MKKNGGITLVALVITIILLLILAGVTIAQLTGNGLFENAKLAKEKHENAQELENKTLGEYENNIKQYASGVTKPLLADGSWNTDKKVNSPKLMEGMTGVYWDNNGNKITVTDENQENWYDYERKQWANAQTKDGSLWVWIPRYAYKITSNCNTSATGMIDVIFLQNETNKNSEDKEISTTYPNVTNYKMEDYVVHPAFLDGESNNYKNGEWDENISGFWVAKFSAGYAGAGMNDINNDIPVVDSGEIYSGEVASKNYYGTIKSSVTTMKYPVFIGQSYAYNNINIGDAYNLSKNLTKTGNPYGLNSAQTDSHQMKNSEWGAVAYLTNSQYGLGGQNLLKINNVYFNITNSTIRSITGYSGEGIDTDQNEFTEVPISLSESINGGTFTSYAWNTIEGQKGSSTQNITGIYDLSGGLREFISAYIENEEGRTNRSLYGSSLISETELKYKTIYPHNPTNDDYIFNFLKYKNLSTSTYAFGDAILETAVQGYGTTSWNGDMSYYPSEVGSFFNRSGSYYNGSMAGIFAFHRGGHASLDTGFRAILIAH